MSKKLKVGTKVRVISSGEVGEVYKVNPDGRVTHITIGTRIVDVEKELLELVNVISWFVRIFKMIFGGK